MYASIEIRSNVCFIIALLRFDMVNNPTYTLFMSNREWLNYINFPFERRDLLALVPKFEANWKKMNIQRNLSTFKVIQSHLSTKSLGKVQKIDLNSKVALTVPEIFHNKKLKRQLCKGIFLPKLKENTVKKKEGIWKYVSYFFHSNK